MIDLITKTVIFLEMVVLVVCVPPTPCPEYFNYTRNPYSQDIMGFIKIEGVPRRTELHLKVTMSVATTLQTKYVGKLELAQTKEDSIRAVDWGRPLYYRLHFPVQQPLPYITGLWFNNQLRCYGPQAMGGIITSIYLEHTLFPPGVLPLSENANNDNEYDDNVKDWPAIRPFVSNPFFGPDSQPIQPPVRMTPPPIRTEAPTVRVTSPPARTTQPPIQPEIRPNPRPQTGIISWPPTSKPETEPLCGRSNVNEVNTLIARGEKTSPGQWPWMVAIFIVKIEFEFLCAGTLLTKKHVLTAAHCFKLQNGIDAPPSTLLVSVGRFRLRDWKERGSVNREVEKYIMHPDYNDRTSADSDIAVLIMRESVEYSSVIQPLCLWSGQESLQSVVGKLGYVVGWGRDELGNPYLSEPRMTRVPIISQEDCLWSNSDFVLLTSNRTFCAGTRDGAGPCNGDSGSGFVMYDQGSKRYHLRGVVSRSLLDRNTMSCDLSQYVVYVDVAKYLGWVRNLIV